MTIKPLDLRQISELDFLLDREMEVGPEGYKTVCKVRDVFKAIAVACFSFLPDCTIQIKGSKASDIFQGVRTLERTDLDLLIKCPSYMMDYRSVAMQLMRQLIPTLPLVLPLDTFTNLKQFTDGTLFLASMGRIDISFLRENRRTSLFVHNSLNVSVKVSHTEGVETIVDSASATVHSEFDMPLDEVGRLFREKSIVIPKPEEILEQGFERVVDAVTQGWTTKEHEALYRFIAFRVQSREALKPLIEMMRKKMRGPFFNLKMLLNAYEIALYFGFSIPFLAWVEYQVEELKILTRTQNLDLDEIRNCWIFAAHFFIPTDSSQEKSHLMGRVRVFGNNETGYFIAPSLSHLQVMAFYETTLKKKFPSIDDFAGAEFPLFEPMGYRNPSPSRGRLDAHSSSQQSSTSSEESPPLYGGVIQNRREQLLLSYFVRFIRDQTPHEEKATEEFRRLFPWIMSLFIQKPDAFLQFEIPSFLKTYLERIAPDFPDPIKQLLDTDPRFFPLLSQGVWKGKPLIYLDPFYKENRQKLRKVLDMLKGTPLFPIGLRVHLIHLFLVEPVGHRNPSPPRGRLDAHSSSQQSSTSSEESSPFYGEMIQNIEIEKINDEFCLYCLQTPELVNIEDTLFKGCAPVYRFFLRAPLIIASDKVEIVYRELYLCEEQGNLTQLIGEYMSKSQSFETLSLWIDDWVSEKGRFCPTAEFALSLVEPILQRGKSDALKRQLFDYMLMLAVSSHSQEHFAHSFQILQSIEENRFLIMKAIEYFSQFPEDIRIQLFDELTLLAQTDIRVLVKINAILAQENLEAYISSIQRLAIFYADPAKWSDGLAEGQFLQLASYALYLPSLELLGLIVQNLEKFAKILHRIDSLFLMHRELLIPLVIPFLNKRLSMEMPKKGPFKGELVTLLEVVDFSLEPTLFPHLLAIINSMKDKGFPADKLRSLHNRLFMVATQNPQLPYCMQLFDSVCAEFALFENREEQILVSYFVRFIQDQTPQEEKASEEFRRLFPSIMSLFIQKPDAFLEFEIPSLLKACLDRIAPDFPAPIKQLLDTHPRFFPLLSQGVWKGKPLIYLDPFYKKNRQKLREALHILKGASLFPIELRAHLIHLFLLENTEVDKDYKFCLYCLQTPELVDIENDLFKGAAVVYRFFLRAPVVIPDDKIEIAYRELYLCEEQGALVELITQYISKSQSFETLSLWIEDWMSKRGRFYPTAEFTLTLVDPVLQRGRDELKRQLFDYMLTIAVSSNSQEHFAHSFQILQSMGERALSDRRAIQRQPLIMKIMEHFSRFPEDIKIQLFQELTLLAQTDIKILAMINEILRKEKNPSYFQSIQQLAICYADPSKWSDPSMEEQFLQLIGCTLHPSPEFLEPIIHNLERFTKIIDLIDDCFFAHRRRLISLVIPFLNKRLSMEIPKKGSLKERLIALLEVVDFSLEPDLFSPLFAIINSMKDKGFPAEKLRPFQNQLFMLAIQNPDLLYRAQCYVKDLNARKATQVEGASDESRWEEGAASQKIPSRAACSIKEHESSLALELVGYRNPSPSRGRLDIHNSSQDSSTSSEESPPVYGGVLQTSASLYKEIETLLKRIELVGEFQHILSNYFSLITNESIEEEGSAIGCFLKKVATHFPNTPILASRKISKHFKKKIVENLLKQSDGTIDLIVKKLHLTDLEFILTQLFESLGSEEECLNWVLHIADRLIYLPNDEILTEVPTEIDVRQAHWDMAKQKFGQLLEITSRFLIASYTDKDEKKINPRFLCLLLKNLDLPFGLEGASKRWINPAGINYVIKALKTLSPKQKAHLGSDEYLELISNVVERIERYLITTVQAIMTYSACSIKTEGPLKQIECIESRNANTKNFIKILRAIIANFDILKACISRSIKKPTKVGGMIIFSLIESAIPHIDERFYEEICGLLGNLHTLYAKVGFSSSELTKSVTDILGTCWSKTVVLNVGMPNDLGSDEANAAAADKGVKEILKILNRS